MKWCQSIDIIDKNGYKARIFCFYFFIKQGKMMFRQRFESILIQAFFEAFSTHSVDVAIYFEFFFAPFNL
jgi:hypothetical protein